LQAFSVKLIDQMYHRPGGSVLKVTSVYGKGAMPGVPMAPRSGGGWSAFKKKVVPRRMPVE